MTDQLITLITGANQGLGYYAVEHLALTGKHHVLLGSRSLQKGEAALKALLESNPKISPSTITAVQIDITDDDSIAALAKLITEKYKKLDILINNAAIALVGNSREVWNNNYNTNVAGTAMLTEAMLPLLRASTAPAPGRRIVFVSSTLGSMTVAAENYHGKPYVQYSASKSALNMLVLHYTNVLKEEGIAALAVCPGFCSTNLNNYGGVRDPADGAAELFYAATEGGAEMSGKFVNLGGKTVPW
jgi:NAD(P)-dependent dehydrogenase (short-subunit alcohol dehydrogenase family)